MSQVTWALAICAAAGWLVTAHAQGSMALPTPEIYTCLDANGRKLTSDRPIAACRDREQQVLNPSGTVKARVGPTLTAKEQAQVEAKARAELVERARQEEERRQDRALLIRYPEPAVHQKERLEALANINRVKQTALARTTDLLAQRTRLGDEMAFYEKDPSRAPAQLQHELRQVDQSLAVQGRLLAELDAQVIRINARFESELGRLAPLWDKASRSID